MTPWLLLHTTQPELGLLQADSARCWLLMTQREPVLALASAAGAVGVGGEARARVAGAAAPNQVALAAPPALCREPSAGKTLQGALQIRNTSISSLGACIMSMSALR